MDTQDVDFKVLWQPCIHHIQGMGKERRITISLSETIQKLEIEKFSLSFGSFRYCADFYKGLLKVGIHKISGTAQKQMFRAIEAMVYEALATEMNAMSARNLLRSAQLSLEAGQHNRIGSMRLWKKHQETINNLLCRMDMHQIKQREEDGKPQLFDLPKECLYNIISRLSNPMDILNLGQTCSYLNILCTDSLLWQQLCFLHFSEKQIASLTGDDTDFCDINWINMFYLLKGRYKLILKEFYGEEVLLCNNCRKIFWKLQGHACFNPDMSPSYLPISPQQLVDMLHL